MKKFHPEKRADLEVREVEGEWLVLDRRHGKIHKFNHTAGVVWRCCDGHHSLDDIIDRVAKTYGVLAETVRTDTLRAVEKLAELGLLKTG